MKPIHLLSAASLAIVSACSTIPNSTKDAFAKPVDCAPAEEALVTLAAALPSGRNKARAVITSLVPAGLALGVVTLDLRDRAKLVSGSLEADIYNKMADITEQCDVDQDALQES